MYQPTHRSLRSRRPNILMPNDRFTDLLHKILFCADLPQKVHRNHSTPELEAHLGGGNVLNCGANVVKHARREVGFDELGQFKQEGEVLGSDHMTVKVDAEGVV